MQIASDVLTFQDVMSYVGRMSLRAFLKSFSPPDATENDEKLHFPYGSFTWERMERRDLPSYAEFYNELTGQNTFASEQECEQYLQKMRTERGVETYRDLLNVYGIADVAPMKEALLVVGELYKARGLNAFKDFISLPSLSFNLAIRSNLRQHPDDYLTVLSPELFKLVRKSCQGGYSFAGKSPLH